MTLVVMSGLPGSGKTLLGNALAIALQSPVYSVDSIERGMWRAGVSRDQPTGLAAYAVAQALTEDQLTIGNSVIADAVNLHPAPREVWQRLATAYEAQLVVVEVRCSDEELHRQRLANRDDDVPPVSWDQVQKMRREYSPWPVETVKVDPTVDELRVLVRTVLAAVR